MEKTVGRADKAIRIILGLLFLVIAFAANPGTVLKVILFVVGIIALVTAITGYCAIYSLLGISTCKKK